METFRNPTGYVSTKTATVHMGRPDTLVAELRRGPYTSAVAAFLRDYFCQICGQISGILSLDYLTNRFVNILSFKKLS